MSLASNPFAFKPCPFASLQSSVMACDSVATYDKLLADPSVGKGDLMEAMSGFFKVNKSRDVGEMLRAIKEAKVTWKTAPKACPILPLCL